MMRRHRILVPSPGEFPKWHNPTDALAGLIHLSRKADVPNRFSDNSDNRRLVEREFFSRANIQRKMCSCPTKNRLVYFTLAGSARHFIDHDARFVAKWSLVAQGWRSPSASNLYSNHAPVRGYQLLSRPVRSDCQVTCAVQSRPIVSCPMV
jgi:hypothetical protein